MKDLRNMDASPQDACSLISSISFKDEYKDSTLPSTNRKTYLSSEERSAIKISNAIDMLEILLDQEIKCEYDRCSGSIINLDSEKLAQHAIWRQNMCEWQYKIVDSIKVSRDVVFTAMSFLDRINKSYGCLNRSFLRLVSITSLYIAIKLKDQNKVTAKTISNFVGCCITADAILSMERFILGELNWFLHPPSPHTFIVMLSTYLPRSIPLKTKSKIIRQAIFFSELTTLDIFFSRIKPSTIALSCLLKGMNDLVIPCFVDDFLESLSKFNELFSGTCLLVEAQSRLVLVASSCTSCPSSVNKSMITKQKAEYCQNTSCKV